MSSPSEPLPARPRSAKTRSDGERSIEQEFRIKLDSGEVGGHVTATVETDGSVTLDVFETGKNGRSVIVATHDPFGLVVFFAKVAAATKRTEASR